MIHIYDQNLKKLDSLNYTIDQFLASPFDCYPDWENTYWATEIDYKYPKLADGELAEKSRLELVLEGIESLGTGEVIQEGEIVYIPCPTEYLIGDWTGNEWVDIATAEDINKEVETLIDAYITLAEKKAYREKYGFSTAEIELEIAENITRRMELLERI